MAFQIGKDGMDGSKLTDGPLNLIQLSVGEGVNNKLHPSHDRVSIVKEGLDFIMGRVRGRHGSHGEAGWRVERGEV